MGLAHDITVSSVLIDPEALDSESVAQPLCHRNPDFSSGDSSLLYMSRRETWVSKRMRMTNSVLDIIPPLQPLLREPNQTTGNPIRVKASLTTQKNRV